MVALSVTANVVASSDSPVDGVSSHAVNTSELSRIFKVERYELSEGDYLHLVLMTLYTPTTAIFSVDDGKVKVGMKLSLVW